MGLWPVVLRFVLNELGSIKVSSTPGFNKRIDVVLLTLEWLMHESEPCSLNLPLIVEDDVKGVLLTTNTVLLTAVGINRHFDEFSHLVVEAEVSDTVGIALISLLASRIDIAFEWTHPGVDRVLNSIVQSREFSIDQFHLSQVVRISVIDIVKDNISWWTSCSIVIQRLKIVIDVGSTDQ